MPGYFIKGSEKGGPNPPLPSTPSTPIYLTSSIISYPRYPKMSSWTIP